ncbi:MULTISPECIES: HPr family phosphocarrier protein [Bacillaceae]|uniref:HPr family phosphocarrier protein n=1 Tax=Bacillaceae TaxID=186817 RepID=UPI001E49C78B|nr:HPr family phosphocarrier protein [Bacillus sp. Au-Bac7]MCE4049407.1 HPr family phosphocarrier protein [Bacillus sp. Au-Bac7]
MLVTKETVRLIRGLQARNTTIFVAKARSFSSDVFLTKNGKASNGKEIMKVMDLNVNTGDEITLLVDGPDEKNAIHTLKNFLFNK